MTPMLSRYYDGLNSMPTAGHGYGFHQGIMSICNYGILAGINPEQIFTDIRSKADNGERRVPDREITDTIRKAVLDHKKGTFVPTSRPNPIINDGKKSLRKITEQGKFDKDADLWESSPIRLTGDVEKDAILFIKTMFKRDDLIWIGERYQPGINGQTIRTVSEWTRHFKNGGSTAPHIVINPLDGVPRPTKTGDKTSLRGDGNVKRFRYCLVEFDDLNRENQIRFWSAVKLPVMALIDTAGKSIHAWLDVQKLAKIETPEQWESQIKIRLYEKILKPLGVDGACSNAARLSRLPGHKRDRKYQKLLYLSDEGKKTC